MKNLITISLFLFSISLFLSCSKDDSTTEISVTAEDFSVSMDENPMADKVIGSIQASTNVGEASFYILNQIPSGAFSINISTGELRVADVSVFNFERNPIIEGTVKVENGSVSKEISVQINLNDLDEVKIYEGDVQLETQQDVEAFGDSEYTQINGNLTIGNLAGYDDIIDLTALYNLKTINGYLYIEGTEELITISGLQNLNNIQGLSIYNNIKLKEIKDLQNITSLPEFLDLENNYLLENLDGLNQLSNVGNIYLYGNINMSSLDWLNNLTTLRGGISLSDNYSLQNLDGLSNLKEIEGFISIINSDLLTNLDGFSNLNNIDIPNITINSNLSLQNIDGLQNIRVTEKLRIEDNQNLSHISGISRIEGSLISISIINNLFLESLEGLSNLNAATYIIIEGSESLTNLYGLNSLTDVTDLRIKSNYSLTNFCDLKDFLTHGTLENPIIVNNAYNPTIQDIINGNCSI